MKTVDFIQNIQEQVLNHYGLQVTNNRHIDCPICDKKQKLRINWYNGDIRAICVCGTYGLLDLLMEVTGQDFKTLAFDIDRTFGNVSNPEEMKQKDTSKRDRAISMFRKASKIKGTDAQVYLQGRGIYEIPTGGVKFGSVFDYTEQREIPAMIALASTDFGEPRQMHITYIEDGKKANISTVRKMHSLSPQTINDSDTRESIAIKLHQATNVLGVAEGIESALSAKQFYKIPTWALINATYMSRFRAPTGVETLYIFADNDKSLTGLAAAMACGKGNLLSSNDVSKVVIRWPEKLNDFNDVILSGDSVVEWIGER